MAENDLGELNVVEQDTRDQVNMIAAMATAQASSFGEFFDLCWDAFMEGVSADVTLTERRESYQLRYMRHENGRWFRNLFLNWLADTAGKDKQPKKDDEYFELHYFSCCRKLGERLSKLNAGGEITPQEFADELSAMKAYMDAVLKRRFPDVTVGMLNRMCG